MRAWVAISLAFQPRFEFQTLEDAVFCASNLVKEEANVANPRNTETLASLRQVLDGQSSFYVVNYQGLPSNDVVKLRKELRGVGATMVVAKNTLMHKALEEKGFAMRDLFHGPSALVLVGEDAVTPIKTLSEFAKKNDKGIPSAKGGVLDGEVMDSNKLEMIASLPSKQELRGQVVGVLMSKLQEFVGILEAKVEKDGGGSSDASAPVEAAAPEAEASAAEAEAAPEAPAAEA
jgi:large subunit ribosomal protein L10